MSDKTLKPLASHSRDSLLSISMDMLSTDKVSLESIVVETVGLVSVQILQRGNVTCTHIYQYTHNYAYKHIPRKKQLKQVNIGGGGGGGGLISF